MQAHDDATSLEVALVENMAREDLNPVEEARAVAALVEELGLTREEVGRRVGRSRVAISNLLRLLDLPDEALALMEEGRLTEGHGRALLLAADHADRRRLARAAADGGWSVRVTEARAREAGAGAPRPRDARPRRPSTPTRRPPPRRSPTRSAPPSEPTSACARAGRASRPRSPSPAPTRPSLWPAACAPARSPEAASPPAPDPSRRTGAALRCVVRPHGRPGRLAQSVRALL